MSCAHIYSALDQTARKINLAKFSLGKCSALIVTDLAARGLDIPLLDNVINYSFPAKGKLFLHRVGKEPAAALIPGGSRGYRLLLWRDRGPGTPPTNQDLVGRDAGLMPAGCPGFSLSCRGTGRRGPSAPASPKSSQ